MTDEWQVLETWTVPSTKQNERLILPEIRAIVDAFGLSQTRQDRLETAIAEAILNAIEHGNGNQSEHNVTVQILASSPSIAVRIKDNSVNGGEIPVMVQPDLAAKIAGVESPRGWGMYLIYQLADQVIVTQGEHYHQVEILMYREGEAYAAERS
jgi:anti-sigma regulatory factor (Ser/Thr protein kinase)